jgi:hypothetical protein
MAGSRSDSTGAARCAVGRVGQAGNEDPRRRLERPLDRSRRRLVPLSAAPPHRSCVASPGRRLVPPALSGDGERHSDGTGALLHCVGHRLLVVDAVDGGMRERRGAHPYGSNAGAGAVHSRSNDLADALTRWSPLHSSIEWDGRDRAGAPADQARATPARRPRLQVAATGSLAGAGGIPSTDIAVSSDSRDLRGPPSLPTHSGRPPDVALGLVALVVEQPVPHSPDVDHERARARRGQLAA